MKNAAVRFLCHFEYPNGFPFGLRCRRIVIEIEERTVAAIYSDIERYIGTKCTSTITLRTDRSPARVESRICACRKFSAVIYTAVFVYKPKRRYVNNF